MSKPKQYTEDSAIALLYDMTAIVQRAFNLDECLAASFAEQLVETMRSRVGGQEIYIPAPDKQARDEQIRREFNGRNRDEVCAKHGISKSRLYEIVRLGKSDVSSNGGGV